MKTLLRIVGVLFVLFVTLLFLMSLVFGDKRPKLDRQLYAMLETGNTNDLQKYFASGGDVNRSIRYHIWIPQLSAPLLDIATEHGQLETVEFLLAKGANPNLPDSAQNPPLTWALGRINDEVPQELYSKILKTLLSAGANPNQKGSSDYTPLHAAASHGQAAMVRTLLAAGADVNATNHCGQTSLHLTRDPETARALLAGGANPDARYVYTLPADKDHPTPVTHSETPADTALRDGYLGVYAVLTNLPGNTNH